MTTQSDVRVIKVPAILALIRIPNLPTTAADILGGALFAGALAGMAHADLVSDALRSSLSYTEFSGVWWAIPLLMLASACLYSASIADNDVQHFEKDTLLNKRGPLVTGAITRGRAAVIAFAGHLAGILLATGSGALLVLGLSKPAESDLSFAVMAFGALSLWIVVASRLYNALAAGRILKTAEVTSQWQPPGKLATGSGVVLMASCRAANMSMGMLCGAIMSADLYRLLYVEGVERMSLQHVLAHHFSGHLWIGAAVSLCYFIAVMGVSLAEDFGAKSRALILPFVLAQAACWTPALLALSSSGNDAARWLPVMFCSIALSTLLAQRFLRAIRDPKPRNIGMIVKWSIAGDCLLMAALAQVSLLDQPGWSVAVALGIALLFVLCALLGRVTYAT